MNVELAALPRPEPTLYGGAGGRWNCPQWVENPLWDWTEARGRRGTKPHASLGPLSATARFVAR